MKISSLLEKEKSSQVTKGRHWKFAFLIFLNYFYFVALRMFFLEIQSCQGTGTLCYLLHLVLTGWEGLLSVDLFWWLGLAAVLKAGGSGVLNAQGDSHSPAFPSCGSCILY